MKLLMMHILTFMSPDGWIDVLIHLFIHCRRILAEAAAAQPGAPPPAAKKLA